MKRRFLAFWKPAAASTKKSKGSSEYEKFFFAGEGGAVLMACFLSDSLKFSI